MRRVGPDAMAIVAEWEAEDRAVAYLATLPTNIAAVAAVKAAAQLAEAWEVEKSEMLRRGDPGPVYLRTTAERLWLESAARKYRGEPCWQHCPAAEVRAHLAGLPPHAAAFVAYWVARYVCRGERLT
jgi:hypothetical protein